MAADKDRLLKLVDTAKKRQDLRPETLKRMTKTIDAAKEAAKKRRT